jgi:hypothetical protein
MKYSILGKFATGLPAHVNELLKSWPEPTIEYLVWEVEYANCVTRNDIWASDDTGRRSFWQFTVGLINRTGKQGLCTLPSC